MRARRKVRNASPLNANAPSSRWRTSAAGAPAWSLMAAGALLLCVAADPARAHEHPSARLEHEAAPAPAFPPDSGVFNVRSFGAVGDGTHDDTSALLAAIAAARLHTEYFWPTHIVYLPAGRYVVTDTLQSRDEQGHFQAQLALVGDGPNVTTIMLPDHTLGFSQRALPKAVLFTSSGLRSGAADAGGKHYRESGEGNDAYANYVEGLTIDIGRDNPGAIALDYLASNIGAVRHVRLRAAAGSGAIGLSMQRRWPGPLLLSDVSIDGFAIGIAVSQPEYGVTLDRVRLRDQTEIALRNSANSLALRDVSIESAATGIVNDDPRGLIVADRLRFVARGAQAVFARNRGYLTLRPSDRKSLGVFARGGTFFGERALREFGADWHLPAYQSATESLPKLEAWVNVASFGAEKDSPRDASAAIQAAFDSGAAVVYFPTGRYKIDRPLDVPASLRHIAGMFSVLQIGQRAAGFTREQGMLRIAGAGPQLTIERLALDNIEQGRQVGIEHAGARALTLRDFIAGGVNVLRRAAGGPLVLENTVGPLDVSGANGVWATQLNVEGQGVLIHNHGSPLAILGLKTEQDATLVETQAGGQTEILGGLVYLVVPPAVARPALTNSGNGRVFAAYVESAYRAGAVYAEHMVQLGARATEQNVRGADLPTRGLGRVLPGRSLDGRGSGAKGGRISAADGGERSKTANGDGSSGPAADGGERSRQANGDDSSGPAADGGGQVAR
jgi:hypothetical protein